VIAGKYGFVYCGVNDVGIGYFAISQDGTVFGKDIGGARTRYAHIEFCRS
jgi:hypothetical protein